MIISTVTLDSCHCVLEWDEPLLNNSQIRFKEQCITHNVPQQALAHNRAFNLRDGTFPTLPQQAQQGIDKALEKGKPQFQRRP